MKKTKIAKMKNQRKKKVNFRLIHLCVRSKAIDMRFCWLKDRAEQGQFEIHWAAGDENWADCFTKHHSATHHKILRPCYLKEQDSPADLQGCLGRLKRVLGKSSGPDPVP